MTALPAAKAAATLCIVKLNGELNGAIAPTNPSGSRMTSVQSPSPPGVASAGTASPASVSAAVAAARSVYVLRSASRSVSRIALPVCRLTVEAMSSRRSLTSCRSPSQDVGAPVGWDLGSYARALSTELDSVGHDGRRSGVHFGDPLGPVRIVEHLAAIAVSALTRHDKTTVRRLSHPRPPQTLRPRAAPHAQPPRGGRIDHSRDTSPSRRA